MSAGAQQGPVDAGTQKTGTSEQQLLASARQGPPLPTELQNSN